VARSAKQGVKALQALRLLGEVPITAQVAGISPVCTSYLSNQCILERLFIPDVTSFHQVLWTRDDHWSKGLKLLHSCRRAYAEKEANCCSIGSGYGSPRSEPRGDDWQKHTQLEQCLQTVRALAR
jgi:hypothetical protein